MCLFLFHFRNLIHVPLLRASHDRFPLPSLLRQRAEKTSKADPVRGALVAVIAVVLDINVCVLVTRAQSAVTHFVLGCRKIAI
jgi:hypothetical protein